MEGLRNLAPLVLVLVLVACGRIGFDATGAGGTRTTIAFQQGVEPSSLYAGVSDTYLQENTPDATNGSDQVCVIDGDDPDATDLDERALVRWDVTKIPPGSVVEAVSITLTSNSSSSDGFGIYALSRPWQETDASWNRASATTVWESPGASGSSDRATTAVGVIEANTPAGVPTPAVLNAAAVAMVQAWVDGAGNDGIILFDSAQTNGLDFWCSQAADPAFRPRLEVTSTAP